MNNLIKKISNYKFLAKYKYTTRNSGEDRDSNPPRFRPHCCLHKKVVLIGISHYEMNLEFHLINSNKWMVVHVVYWPKSYDKGFFDWIKLTDIYKVKLFFGVIPKSLPKKKNNYLLYENL